MGRDKGVFYDRKAIHTTEAVGYVPPCSHSHPFDTALRAYSGQAVDLQEATSEPGIRVSEYCLVISQWRQLLWPRGDLSACPHRQIDSAPRSCCGLREKTPDPFSPSHPEKGDGPKSQKGLPDPLSLKHSYFPRTAHVCLTRFLQMVHITRNSC